MNYDPNKRKADPGDDDLKVEAIQVDFALPVFIESNQQCRLADLLEEIARSPKNTPENGVHWQSGVGSKPNWSQADAMFLGKPVDTDAPEKGEPTFDDTVLYFETSARESSPEEEQAGKKFRARWMRSATGAQLIAEERRRQIEEDGCTAEHDDMHCEGALVRAAACYALHAFGEVSNQKVRRPIGIWPWPDEQWKPANEPVRNLVKAGALIAAEIDRIKRLHSKPKAVPTI